MSTFEELYASQGAGGTAAGDEQKDAWYLLNSEGEIVMRGSGAIPEFDGEYTFRWRQDLESLALDPFVADHIDREVARKHIRDSDFARDPGALADKLRTFRAFLANEAASEGVVAVDDPNVINAQRYEPLYDEYWNTFDLTDHTPWTLARAGIQRARAAAAKDTQRRRYKLLARRVLERPRPSLPES